MTPGNASHPHTVQILIDGEPHSVEPGTYTINHLGLDGVSQLTREQQPVTPLVIGGNDTFEIRGGESFRTDRGGDNIQTHKPADSFEDQRQNPGESLREVTERKNADRPDASDRKRAQDTKQGPPAPDDSGPDAREKATASVSPRRGHK